MIEIRSFRDIVRLCCIFRREFLYAATATLAIALVGALLLPKRFESQAQLQIKPTASQQLAPPLGMDANGFIQPSTQRDPVLDEEQLLTNWPVVRRVAAAYLQIAGTPPAGWWARVKFYLSRGAGALKEGLRRLLVGLNILDPATPLERTARTLLKQFSASHAAGSQIINISMRWNDPALAQALNQAWIDAYFDAHAQTSGDASLYALYQQQSAKLAERIRSLRQQIQQRLHTLGLQQQLDALEAQLQRLQQQRQDAISGRIASLALQQSAKQELGTLPTETVSERQVSLNPAKQDLLLKLNGLEAQRLQLLRTYVPGSPPIREIEQSIQALQAELPQMANSVQRSQNLTPNALAAKLRQNIADAQNHAASLQGLQSSLDAQIGELEQQRDQLLNDQPDLDRLGMQLKAAEQVFSQDTAYLLRLRIALDLNTQRLNDVRLIEAPTFMPARVFPKTVSILLLAPAAALAVGLFTIFLCYLLDLRIHDSSSMQVLLRQAVWASLPDLGQEPSDLAAERFQAGLRHIVHLLSRARSGAYGLRVALTSSHPDEGVHFLAQQLVAAAKSAGYKARLASEGERAGQATPQEWIVIAAAPVGSEQMTAQLRDADVRLLVVAARHTQLPQVQYALELLKKLFGAVDGLILHRQRFDIPPQLWRWLHPAAKDND